MYCHLQYNQKRPVAEGHHDYDMDASSAANSSSSRDRTGAPTGAVGNAGNALGAATPADTGPEGTADMTFSSIISAARRSNSSSTSSYIQPTSERHADATMPRRQNTRTGEQNHEQTTTREQRLPLNHDSGSVQNALLRCMHENSFLLQSYTRTKHLPLLRRSQSDWIRQR